MALFGVADLRRTGWLPLQDQDPTHPIDLRVCVFACRIGDANKGTPALDDYGRYNVGGMMGDLTGGLVWPTPNQAATAGQAAPGTTASTTGSGGSTPQSTGTSPRGTGAPLPTGAAGVLPSGIGTFLDRSQPAWSFAFPAVASGASASTSAPSPYTAPSPSSKGGRPVIPIFGGAHGGPGATFSWGPSGTNGLTNLTGSGGGFLGIQSGNTLGTWGWGVNLYGASQAGAFGFGRPAGSYVGWTSGKNPRPTSQTIPVVAGRRGSSPREHIMVQPIGDLAMGTDPRFSRLGAGVEEASGNFGAVAANTKGILLATMNENSQEEIFLPTSNTILASWAGGHHRYSTRVADLTGPNPLNNRSGNYVHNAEDSARRTGVDSFWRVFAPKDGQYFRESKDFGPECGLAWQLGAAIDADDSNWKPDQKGARGHGFISGSSRVGNTEIPYYAGMKYIVQYRWATTANASSWGPTIVVGGSTQGYRASVNPKTAPPITTAPNKTAVIATTDGNLGGCLFAGLVNDQHDHGSTVDGEKISSAHIPTSALFHDRVSVFRDAPLDFNNFAEYPEWMNKGGFPYKVILGMNPLAQHYGGGPKMALGMWTWWCDGPPLIWEDGHTESVEPSPQKFKRKGHLGGNTLRKMRWIDSPGASVAMRREEQELSQDNIERRNDSPMTPSVFTPQNINSSPSPISGLLNRDITKDVYRVRPSNDAPVGGSISPEEEPDINDVPPLYGAQAGAGTPRVLSGPSRVVPDAPFDGVVAPPPERAYDPGDMMRTPMSTPLEFAGPAFLFKALPRGSGFNLRNNKAWSEEARDVYSRKAPVVGKLIAMVPGSHGQASWTTPNNSSRYQGGTASGMIVWVPPELDPEDADDSWAPPHAPTISTLSVIALREKVKQGYGLPDATTGALKAGFVTLETGGSATAAGVYKTKSVNAGVEADFLDLDYTNNRLKAYVPIAGTSLTLTTDLAVADGGTGASTAAGARTNLGSTTVGDAVFIAANAAAARAALVLGTISTQDSNSVAITGGAITGITDLAVADGGTGASTALAARTALAVAGLADANDFTALNSVKAGSAASQQATLGGTILNTLSQAANVDAAATDLHTHTIPANTLDANGDSLEFYAAGTMTNSVNAKEVRWQYGGTTIATLTLPTSTTGSWVIRGSIVRTGAAAQKVTFEGAYSTASGLAAYKAMTKDLTTALDLIVVGKGGASNEVFCEVSKVWWEPGAPA